MKIIKCDADHHQNQPNQYHHWSKEGRLAGQEVTSGIFRHICSLLLTFPPYPSSYFTTFPLPPYPFPLLSEPPPPFEPAASLAF